MDIRPLTEREALGRLIADQPLNPFLQSWAWGDFQHALGRPIWRLGAWEGDQLVGAALVIEHQLILGKTYLYCPRGPLAMSLPVLQALLQALRDLGKQQEAMYVKVDPGLYHFPFSVDDFPREYSPGTSLQPQYTQVIDTGREPSWLLERMHQKTRYNVRLAEKKGVTVRWSTSDEDFTSFMKLQHATAEHQGIRLHPDGYYQAMYQTLKTHQMTELVIGEYQGQPLVINQIIWCGQTATFIHGGSSTEHKEAMVPYLVQWRTIEEANRRGVKDYDLRGIAPDDIPDHKLAGVTRFKKGLGGKEVVYSPAANVILQPQWYLAYRLAKRMRGGRDE